MARILFMDSLSWQENPPLRLTDHWRCRSNCASAQNERTYQSFLLKSLGSLHTLVDNKGSWPEVKNNFSRMKFVQLINIKIPTILTFSLLNLFIPLTRKHTQKKIVSLFSSYQACDVDQSHNCLENVQNSTIFNCNLNLEYINV